MFNDLEIISVDDIKEVTSISKNIDAALLEPYITIAEEFYVYDLVGDSLITEIKNQLTGNTITDLNNKLIVQYIRPVVAYAAWFEAAPFIYIKTTQKGIVKQSSENSETVTNEEYDIYRKEIKSKIQFYQDRLKKYLEEYKAIYPLYRTTSAPLTGYSNGIYLGKGLD